MKLQGRNLKLNMKGEDVRLLHSELRRLGFDIPENEAQVPRYGSGTREVISRFQADHDLESSGIVDDQTTKVIIKSWIFSTSTSTENALREFKANVGLPPDVQINEQVVDLR